MTATGRDTSPAVECRCPVGWPQTVFTQEFTAAERRVVREHHRNLCGLPDEATEQGQR